MDVAQKYIKISKAKDIDGLMSIVTEDVHFTTPMWETKGKAALKKKILSDDPPEAYGETELEEHPGGKFVRRLKAKVAFGMITLKIQQTITVVDGKVSRMVAKKL